MHSSPVSTRKIGAAMGLAVLFLLLTAVPGWSQSAAPPTREQYIAQADPICQATFKTKLPKIHGKNDFRGLARILAISGHRIGVMTDNLERLAMPTADIAGLTNWLKSLRSWSKSAAGVARAIHHRDVRGYRRSAKQLNQSQKMRLHLSRGYGFQVCN
jgi:hypothetical protein